MSSSSTFGSPSVNGTAGRRSVFSRTCTLFFVSFRTSAVGGSSFKSVLSYAPTTRVISVSSFSITKGSGVMSPLRVSYRYGVNAPLMRMCSVSRGSTSFCGYRSPAPGRSLRAMKSQRPSVSSR